MVLFVQFYSFDYYCNPKIFGLKELNPQQLVLELRSSGRNDNNGRRIHKVHGWEIQQYKFRILKDADKELPLSKESLLDAWNKSKETYDDIICKLERTQ